MFRFYQIAPPSRALRRSGYTVSSLGRSLGPSRGLPPRAGWTFVLTHRTPKLGAVPNSSAPTDSGTHVKGTLLATALWTAAALLAFAGNSVLCRAALWAAPGEAAPISPAGFTGIRLLSGALVLAPLLWRAAAPASPRRFDAASVFALAVYAIAFSLSYVTLPAGPGALILFGTVQITMVIAAAMGRETLRPLRIFGMLVAFAGLARLVAGRSSAAEASWSIDPLGAALMAIAGVGWGVYTLRGRGGGNPTRTTALNFVGAAPAALIFGAWSLFAESTSWQGRGVWLAAASGAITSGAGYAIWYHALRGHSRTSAAAVQLTVPIIAALGGALFLGEAITRPLAESTILTLGGVAIALKSGTRSA